MLIDTHCHIHESSYPLDVDEVLKTAQQAGVAKMVCVGTSQQSSEEAVAFAAVHENVHASIGVHPHDSKDGSKGLRGLMAESNKIVAIGEIGLDYFYTHSPREVQIHELEAQLQLACDYSLPVIFHVREAFEDFWPIYGNFSQLNGVLHSFTDTDANMQRALAEGLYIGINGISTFTKDAEQQRMFARVPLERTLLETDAPFLTPSPFRGKVNMPSMVSEVAKHYAASRGLEFDDMCRQTTANAKTLFRI